MLVAVNRSASTHSAIERAGRFCVNLLGTHQTALVDLFSSGERRDQRFQSDAWRYADGLPYLPDACASIFCAVRTSMRFGTHELFIGEVFDVRSGTAPALDPLCWIEGGYARLGRLD